MRFLQLYNDTRYIALDDEDYEWAKQYNWHMSVRGDVFRSFVRKRQGIRKVFKLHREVMKAPEGVHVDHINHDHTDCRKQNLRFCTLQENNYNKRPLRNAASKYKGVFACKSSKLNPWRAHIARDGKINYLGVFPTEEEAARAYNKAAKEYFGEFAWLNPV